MRSCCSPISYEACLSLVRTLGEEVGLGVTNGYQLLDKILYYHVPTKDPPDPIISRTEKAHARKRLLLLGLKATSSKSVSVPIIYLSGESILKMNLRKPRGKDGSVCAS